MEASPVQTIQYFDGSKQGVIPLFQRPYSWEPKDWDTLWDDLYAQYEEEDRALHFMGAIVTVPVKSVPVGVTKHLVIDGQQRLTTLSILLAAIRTRAEEQGDNGTSGIIGDLLTNRHYQAPDDLKLVPTQVDRAAYNALVYQKDLSAFGESRIVQAYKHFLKKLAGKDNDGAPLKPSQIFQAIQQSLQVVMINLGEADDPYLIFESLNHKGKPLNQGDLVRNYVLMRFQHSTASGGEQELVYEDLWRPMESYLGENMPEFLRHYAMRTGKKVRKGDIYTSTKTEFEACKNPEAVRSLLIQMKASAKDYSQFLSPELTANKQVCSYLNAIKDLDSTVFYPLMMRLYQATSSEHMTEDDLVKCLAYLESYYLRRLICNVPTNALNKITLEICSNLPTDGHRAWLRENLLQSSGASRQWPSDDEFHSALINQKLYPRHRVARYVLISLEESFEHKEPVDTSTATIEHIMPQTLSPEWKDHLGAEFEKVQETWGDTLGNLTLTGYNSELNNDHFDVKKEKLRNTHFELSRSILAQTAWTAAEIAARGEMLAKRALVRWPRP